MRSPSVRRSMSTILMGTWSIAKISFAIWLYGHCVLENTTTQCSLINRRMNVSGASDLPNVVNVAPIRTIFELRNQTRTQRKFIERGDGYCMFSIQSVSFCWNQFLHYHKPVFNFVVSRIMGHMPKYATAKRPLCSQP